MLRRYLDTEKEIFTAAFLLSALAVLVIPFTLYGVLFSLILLGYVVWGIKYLPALLVVMFLVVTSDISEELRIAVSIVGMLLAMLLFLKKYGLNFKEFPKLPRQIYLFCLLVFVSLFLSTLTSEDIVLSSGELTRQLIFFALAYFFFALADSKQSVDAYISALLVSGVIIAFFIIKTFFQSDAAVYLLQTEGLVHEGGYFKNVAAAGGIFAVTIPLNLALIFKKDLDNQLLKVFLLLVLIFQSLGLFLTNSRAAILAVVISVAFILFVLNRKSIKKIISGVFLVLVSIVMIFPQLFDAVSLYLRFNRVFANTRYFLWDIAYDIIKDNFILGVGPGMFKFYMYKYLPAAWGSWDEKQIAWLQELGGLGHAHNFFLFRFSELGIIGIITALVLPVLFFYFSFAVQRKFKNENEIHYPLVVGITGSGLGIVYRSFFEATGLLSHGWITRDLPFWLMFIIIIYFYKQIQNKKAYRN